VNVSEIFQRENYLALPLQGKHMPRKIRTLPMQNNTGFAGCLRIIIVHTLFFMVFVCAIICVGKNGFYFYILAIWRHFNVQIY
jgi:hypothetical protein